MSETGKIIIGIFVAFFTCFGIYKFLSSIFSNLLQRYFGEIDNKFKELYESRNKHEIDIAKNKKDIEQHERRIQKIEDKCDMHKENNNVT